MVLAGRTQSTHAIRIVPSPVDYLITTTYHRERSYRRWWLARRTGIPLIEAYEALAERYPRGLAELAPLDVELSGEVQEVLTR